MLTQFMQRVVEEAARYKDRRDAVRAGLIERLITRSIRTDRMHPNPDDEFTDVRIGPNDEIISHYVEEICRCRRMKITIFEEPVIVQKMGRGEYMILNGHHRWAAAVRTATGKIHALIVNTRSVKDGNRKGDRA